MENKNNQETKEVLELYDNLKIKVEDFSTPFDPAHLGEEYKNFTIYKSGNFTFTTSSFSLPL
jgi:hypothetical protein